MTDMEPFKIVDAHIHLWDLVTHRYPWMEAEGENFTGDTSAIKRDYLVSDYAADIAGLNIVKTVHIDANHDPADPVEETRWLQSLADQANGYNWPNAIVAAADFSQADVERILAEHCAFPNVRGIRQILNVHTDPFYDYVGRDYMSEPMWQQNFKLLRKYNLSFDLQLYPSQMKQAADLAHDNSDTLLLLNHAGMFADRSNINHWREWRNGLHILKEQPNIMVKISGLGFFDHDWTLESIRPYVYEIIDLFGVERCMFASDAPVDKLYRSIKEIWQSFFDVTQGFSDTERTQLFSQNAEKAYRI